MAEAVRPARRAKAKASRPKAKEKKKSETRQREEFDEVSLLDSARELEIPTPACELTGDQPKALSDSELPSDARGQDESEMFDVQLSSLTITDEGALTWNTETLKEGEEVGACVGGDAVRLKVDPGDNVGTKVGTPKNLTEVEESKLVHCGPSESTLQSSFSYNLQEMEHLQVRETQHSKEDKQALNLPSKVLQNVGLQSSCDAMDVFQPHRVKKLYPQLPAEIAEVPTLVAPKPLLHHERLYPELPSQPEVVPFTKEQLKIFEPGSWLENVESYLEEFNSMAHQDRHEFYELLLNYSRCRKQLILAEAELFALTSDCQNAKSRLWHFKEEQLSAQGICADQVKVSGYHRYQRVEMSENALGELKKLFDAKSEHLHQTLALHSYTSVLSRLQVESYIYTLLNSSAVLRSLAVHQQGRASKQVESIPSDLCQLKECISVLFMFTRRVNEDTQFRDDILLWLQKLVSVLQRVGCLGDHLFLLNHILRCPAGVSKWAVPFIQIRVLDNPSGVFHFMQSLALLMSPVRNRAEFLCHMKPSEGKPSTSGPASGPWTLVDEGGEEDEDPETGWILLNEDDLVILFSQFPFHELFQHLLGFKAKGDYLPETTRPQEMMKIFAFANSLVELLAVGLETFNRARYRQFVKRIGYMIRMTLGYVSDHWAQYVSHNQGVGLALEPYSLEKLQVEFDELFLRAVLHVLKAKRLGIWLFMSEMPFGTLSVQMLWKLFYLMHQAESGTLETLCTALPPTECKKQLQDPEHFVNFEKCLSSMNSSEEICLLTTFAQMAQARRADVDEDFVKIIVLEIYEVSYVTLSTRETFSKVGRELLGAITAVHPEIISILLDRVQDTIDQVGMVSLYLFKELPLYLWRPSASEIAVIRDWLLNCDLTMVKNKLACVILEGLNWGFGEQGTLHLDQAVHAEVALMILEAYQKYLAQKPYAGILSESMKQVSYLASIVRYGETPETSFNQWAWNLILRLKLHKNDHRMQQNCPAVPFSSTVPDMTESPTFHPLLKAVKAGVPIGCYLALAMTSVGHSIEKFCAEGIPLLGILVQSRHLRTVVHVLDKILPLFYPCQYYLLKNEQFLSHLLLFLHLDSGVPQGVTQQVTHKVAQHLTGASHGDNVKLLNSMIQAHISVSTQPNEVGPVAVLEFWVQALISQHLWFREQPILFLMDHLCKTAFQLTQEDCVQKLLYQQHKNALGYHCDRSLLSSLVSWIVAGNITPSFVEGLAMPTQVWFAWTVLNMESIFEEDSQLRRVVEGELVINPSFTPDQALKKAQAQLKLPLVPSLQRLLIYRWAHQALVTPSDHPLLPLIWQKFFLLYLHRPGPQYGLPIDGCIGRRFFQSPAHINLLKEMKRRLTEVADFHHAASKALRVPAEGSEGLPESQAGTPAYLTSPELHTELVRLFNVYILWLEDENFQKGDTYIPTLPKHYDTHRLAKVMQNQQDLWMEYLNMERIHYEFQETIGLWIQAKLESHSTSCSLSVQLDFTDPFLAKERVLSNLQKHDAPQPPLALHPMRPPVPVISSDVLLSQKDTTQLVRTDLNLLRQQARTAALWESQQVALDSELLDTMPKQYVNREEQTTLHLECRGISGKRCQGAAVVTVQFEGMHKNEAVSQQLHALWKEVKQLQAEATKPPPLNIVEAAVHAENLITTLVNAYKLQPTPGVQKVGISLFFTVVDYVSDETQRHPPTRQFFTSCIEILGQVFISGTKSECRRVLETILKNRRLCSLLSPFFTPNAAPAEFIQLYEKVVRFLSEDNSDMIFMLLTKFHVKQWLNASKPPLSERTRLLESIHLALTAWGLEPDEDILLPFNLFCKHWTYLLLYQFPDQYSDILRLLMQSSAEQLLSPECWKATLRALGCCVPNCQQGAALAESMVLQNSPDALLSDKQVMETIQWLSNFFYKLRLSTLDFKSFGLFSKWSPYMDDMKTLLGYLVKRLLDSEMDCLAQDPSASSKTVLRSLHSVIIQLFKPWILVLEDSERQRHYPWLESDAVVASGIVQLFTDCIGLLHERFKVLGNLLPGDAGALQLHLMHYCETCTAPKMPEFILYALHSAYEKLPWRDLRPDQMLMEVFFKVERGSPKSCFLFLGSVLCEVNWVSVLSDAWSPSPLPETRSMVVCLLFMMILLAKEDQLVDQPDSPLLSLLGQTSSLSWHLVDMVSYQSVLGYFSSHYQPSILLAKESSAELIVKLLKVAAGLSIPTDSQKHLDAVPKCRAFIHQMVQFLSSLEQNGKITLAILEQEMSKLLDDIIVFNLPDVDSQTRHMALSSLFMEVLMMMNNATIPTAEFLRGSVRTWIEQKVHGLVVLPLLTATCQSLASVRHMAEMTEACITAYFREGSLHQIVGWGPILVSLQVPELTIEEFLQECLSLGSYLTLYVYLLQCLNSEQTLRNEMKVLLLLSKWLEQVYPRSAQEEAKLFLWWHQVLQLSLIQTEQNDSVLTESVIRILLLLQSRQNLLAEERLSSGILGAIGFGRKSPLSNRFRVVARGMAAFLSVQVPAEDQIRLKPGSELYLTIKAQQALSTLESLTLSKQYVEYQEHISQAAQFIKHPGHCLHDGKSFLALLVNRLYPEVHYLDNIR
ncbi:ectopic P granules protein 5 homolog isoform X2 [Pipistrellus kuhlii]|uniref:Ectopic P-granules autophagy protein 5-like protein n=1 Tax=Pipistrellus kuhlii TaxID=59472 RepID=A0A7J7Y8S1_PIPKU|nr:ectopic P granules protein 5 homolog isoform X2 [Pipistrellus kuhlii]KAF6358234.1 ectopic P-granules autophagy protein 5-like protein [Pipistrellus kuhlii]